MKIDIQALIEKIKEKLPFGKKEEEVEVEEVIEESADGEEKVEAAEVDVEEEDEGEEEEEESEEDATKKKRSKYIKIAAGIVVAFFALDEFTKDKEGSKPQPTKKVRAKKKSTKKPKKTPKKKVAKKKKVEKEVKVVVEPKAAPAPAPAPVPAPPVVEKKVEIKREISSVPPAPKQEPETLALDVTEIVDEIETPSKEEIQRPAEFVAAPDYNEVGRGLVYNCKGKHWACVDKYSYFACRDNLKWSKENSKPFECFTKDVYKNEVDCRVIQTHFVNTNEKTDFCK